MAKLIRECKLISVDEIIFDLVNGSEGIEDFEFKNKWFSNQKFNYFLVKNIKWSN